MKKMISIILCILLLAVLTTAVFAAGGVSFSMSASSTSLQRGDTITLTASAYSGEPGTSYGLMLAYDHSVFEEVSGSTAVAGALVNSFNNGFAFMFQTPTAYSGTVGSVTLRVKDTAAFGNFTISGSASVLNGNDAVSASGCSVSVSVVCNHSYGSWTNLDSTNHQKTCTVCTDVQTEVHTWDKGTTVKAANCKEGGEVKYTCPTCSATRTENTEKTDDHKYGAWIKVSDTQHRRTCSVCTKEETVNHSWDGGKVTKPATCKETGIQTYTCSGCKGTKTEVLEKTTTHNYGKWTKVDENNHKHICADCQKEETLGHSWNSGAVTKQPTCKEEGVKTYTCSGCNATKTEVLEKTTTHTYDHDCDTDCNICGVTRTTTHNYKTYWSKDIKEHWHECSACKDRKDVAAHTPSAAPTETTAQTCTVCAYVIQPALGHKHKYATEWTTDDKGHWYACSGCEEKGNYEEHDFENDCDPDCSICGETRKTQHTFEAQWQTDTKKHWHLCSSCGLKQDEAAHEPGAEASETAPQVCTICQFELAPMLATETTEPTEGTEATEPAPQTVSPENSFPWWILVVAVAAVGGIVAFVIIKKKKQ